MTNKKISALQMGIILSFIILSNVTWIGLENIIVVAGRDAYISIIVAGLLGIIPLLMIIKINDNDNDLDIKAIIIKIFGKYIGTIINIIIGVIILITGIVTMYGLSNFIISQFLSDTNVIYISIVIGIIVLYAVSKGLDVIARTGVLLLIINIILFSIANISLTQEIDINYIKPILEYGIKFPIWGGILLFLTNIVPIYMVLMIPRCRITDNNRYNKYLIFFYIFSIIIVFITTFITISALGINLAKMYQYPEYIILKRISLFGFLDRIENIICIQWIFRGFIMLCMIVYYISNSIYKDGNSKLLSFTITSIIIVTSLWYFKNNTIFGYFILNIYPYINMILFMIFVIIGIGKRIAFRE